MKKLKQDKFKMLLIAITLTLFLICGVPAIIFGASKNITLLLIAGIVMTALGFYCMPLTWVFYVEKCKYVSVLDCIVNDNILKVDNLKQNLGCDETQIVKIINYLINKRYLVGYLFIDNKELKKMQQEKEILITNKCPYCGANIELDNEVVTCQYCNSKFKINKK